MHLKRYRGGKTREIRIIRFSSITKGCLNVLLSFHAKIKKMIRKCSRFGPVKNSRHAVSRSYSIDYGIVFAIILWNSPYMDSEISWIVTRDDRGYGNRTKTRM